MPTYDYGCTKCENTFEVVHFMSEKPTVVCPVCGSLSRKIPSLCSIARGNSLEQRKHNDRFRREGAMRLELKENFGLEKVKTIGNHTIGEVYADIKSRPECIKEAMAHRAAESALKTKLKQREWKKKAVKRATPRRIEMERRKAAEDFKKRSIRI